MSWPRSRRSASDCSLTSDYDQLRKDTTMFKLTVRYTRYVLASLASVGFGWLLN
jgi:hypothetical protein